MGIFGKSKANMLATAFYKYGLEDNHLDDLCITESGGSKKGILRDSDFNVLAADAYNRKTIEKFDRYIFNYMVWFPGRMVWISEVLNGKNLTKLFDNSELKDINEKNATKALASKWKKFVKEPDLVFPEYTPRIIFYKKIDVCRYINQKGVNNIHIRIEDFTFEIHPEVPQKNMIKDTRSKFLDRDDMRFLQHQVADSNLK